MKRIIAVLLALVAFPALAYFPHGVATIGKAQINLGTQEITAGVTLNLFNTSGISFFNATQVAAVDGDLLPINTFTNTVNNLGGQSDPTLNTLGPYVFGWDAGRSCFSIVFNGNFTVNSYSNAGVSNNAPYNLTVTGNCSTAGQVNITFAGFQSFAWHFDSAYVYYASNTSGKFYMVRADRNGTYNDLNAYLAGNYWTPEFINLLKGMKPESIRTMGWTPQTNLTVENWAYRKQTSNIGWWTVDHPLGTRCGGTTSFCTMSIAGSPHGGDITSAAAADTSLTSWVDGEQITGWMPSTIPVLSVSLAQNNGGFCQLTVSDTTNLNVGQRVEVQGIQGTNPSNYMDCDTKNIGSTTQTALITSIDTPGTNGTITLDRAFGTNQPTSYGAAVLGYQTLAITGAGGGKPPKLITGINATPGAVSSGPALFTYNKWLDKLIYGGGGVVNHPPIEAMVQLANKVNANYWFNLPPMASDDYVKQSLNAIYSNLNGNLKLLLEYSNEVWNSAFAPSQYSVAMGSAIHLATCCAPFFETMRIRQIMGNVVPTTSWNGSSRIERLFCDQSGNSNTLPYANGSIFPFPGDATYQTYQGAYSGVNYSASPNRPIDFVDTICYAPYTGGGTALSGQSPDTKYFATTYDKTLLDAIVSACPSGVCNSTAISLVDQSVRGDYLNRVQTITASGATFTTSAAHNFSVNDYVRFTVVGGTTYSGVDVTALYQVLSTPLTTTFTVGKIVNGATGSAVNAGSSGTGTTSVGYTVTQTPFGMASTWFDQSESVAKSMTNNNTGLSPKTRWYEGSLEVTPPTVSQCITAGYSSGDANTYCDSVGINNGTMNGYIQNAIVAWKNDPMSAATQKLIFDIYKGTVSGYPTSGNTQSIAPSQLTLLQAVPIAQAWSLVPNTNLGTFTPYQTYYGFSQFSSAP